MYICIYVCTVYMYVNIIYMYVYIYICMYICMYICIYVCIYVCIFVCIYVNMYVNMYTVYVCIYVCKYVCICMYICMYRVAWKSLYPFPVKHCSWTLLIYRFYCTVLTIINLSLTQKNDGAHTDSVSAYHSRRAGEGARAEGKGRREVREIYQW